ncbi:MAG: 16S rRNA (cytosine(967)-C(5))-methyltransferase RsmB [Legionella sp.]|nr:16S rRNA (cytosine(967)-C(5))-methyltransferase RsmB [Legionella sp.]
MSKNDRLQALRILIKVVENKTPLTHLLQAGEDISPLTKAICFGVCRHYFRLQALADSLVEKRPQVMEIWLALLMGLYQLQFLNKPEYAAVKETVDLLDKLKKPWAKGLVNAVLRRFCREREAILARLASQPDFEQDHPTWLVARLKNDWPHHWQAILSGNDKHPPMSLRVNQQHGSRDDYLNRLEEAGIAATPHQFSPVGIILETPCEVSELPGFARGDVSIQDEAAQLAVSLLALKPGLRVLDACAAPGGKTCHILETEPELADCIALDIDENRLRRVRENLKRLSLKATVRQGDVLDTASWWDGKLFDRILLDAPCSATGVIRRHPDIKLLRTEEDISAVAGIQANMLKTMWPLLQPDGLLVYATCSVMKQENEAQIAKFLSNQPDCQVETSDKNWGQNTGMGWQLMPGNNNCDGFFYSVLSKKK